MNPLLSWGLAVAAVVTGYVGYGWPGVALAATVIVFWLLLQFSRALRVMRQAAERPLASVDSAVMLQSRLLVGMHMMKIVTMTRSLGRKVADDPETFVWEDANGHAVRVEMRGGRCQAWQLQRAPAAEPPADAPT
ncbi:MAG: hypothetical protein Q8N44_15545 [Rubrivivax sp.]|nr:hypothetical protein [Rubrivivax sp.]